MLTLDDVMVKNEATQIGGSHVIDELSLSSRRRRHR
jgi:hypothetical protein